MTACTCWVLHLEFLFQRVLHLDLPSPMRWPHPVLRHPRQMMRMISRYPRRTSLSWYVWSLFTTCSTQSFRCKYIICNSKIHCDVGYFSVKFSLCTLFVTLQKLRELFIQYVCMCVCLCLYLCVCVCFESVFHTFISESFYSILIITF